MQSFNILFSFREETHIASVQYTSFNLSYTIYFTDVELVLEFGNKAELTRDGVLIPIKTQNNLDLYLLQEAIVHQLNNMSLVA